MASQGTDDMPTEPQEGTYSRERKGRKATHRDISRV